MLDFTSRATAMSNGKSPTGHSVRVHAELAVLHCSLVQTGFQPLHHRSCGRQTEQTLEDKRLSVATERGANSACVLLAPR